MIARLVSGLTPRQTALVAVLGLFVSLVLALLVARWLRKRNACAG